MWDSYIKKKNTPPINFTMSSDIKMENREWILHKKDIYTYLYYPCIINSNGKILDRMTDYPMLKYDAEEWLKERCYEQWKNGDAIPQPVSLFNSYAPEQIRALLSKHKNHENEESSTCDKIHYLRYIGEDTKRLTQGKLYKITKDTHMYALINNNLGYQQTILFKTRNHKIPGKVCIDDHLWQYVYFYSDPNLDDKTDKNKFQNTSENEIRTKNRRTKMKFQKTTLIDGTDVRDLHEDRLITMIKTQEDNAATLEKVKTPSKYIVKKIKQHRRNAAKLAKLLDKVKG